MRELKCSSGDITYKSGGGAAGLSKHVKRWHPRECELLADDFESSAPTWGSGSSKRSLSEAGLREAALTEDVRQHYKSAKKLRDCDPKQQLFLRLLSMFVVFARLPFRVVDNPWFRAFVWFLDPMVVVPGRKTLVTKVLPLLLIDVESEVKCLLTGVLGVAVCFDLWMSRHGEDVLSMDAFFITPGWEWRSVHVGLVHCKDGTTGATLAADMKPLLAKFSLMDRIFAYVKDQGSNLKRAAAVLSDGVNDTGVSCDAVDRKAPYAGDCYAHAINGACNGSVIAAKNAKFKTFNVTVMPMLCLNDFKCALWLASLIILCELKSLFGFFVLV